MADLSVIVTLWVCSMLGFMLCALRLILRKARRQEYNAGDMFTLVASICVLVRVVFVHLITVWGTTNSMSNIPLFSKRDGRPMLMRNIALSDEARAAGDLSDEEFYQRTVGSQLTVANRLFYNVL